MYDKNGQNKEWLHQELKSSASDGKFERQVFTG